MPMYESRFLIQLGLMNHYSWKWNTVLLPHSCSQLRVMKPLCFIREWPSEKWKELYAAAFGWIRCRLSFVCFVQQFNVHVCIRGVRSLQSHYVKCASIDSIHLEDVK